MEIEIKEFDKVDESEDLLDFKKRISKNIYEIEMPSFFEGAIRRPKIVLKDAINYKTRYELFIAMIKNLDFGEVNNSDFVSGIVECINKNLVQAEIYDRNLIYLEKEIEKNLMNKTYFTNYDTGYYVGYSIIDEILKESRAIMMRRISEELEEILK